MKNRNLFFGISLLILGLLPISNCSYFHVLSQLIVGIGAGVYLERFFRSQ